MSSYDFRTAVDYALRSYDAEDLISAVKRAVFDELKELDPTANIENTSYYNHSFIPDFVLTWNESGRKTDRQVFLRPSMLSATAGHDIENLGQNAPVLLALRSTADPLVQKTAAQHIGRAPDVLLTDVNAVSQIAFESGLREQNPLHSLVRNNLVRGGRGIIVSDTARRINDAIDHSSDDVAELREFTDIVGNLFVRDAAARLQRAAQILEMGITGDLSLLRDYSNGVTEAIAGVLSNAEVRVLLPYLLGRRGVTEDPAYWSHIGSMLTLDVLEDMWNDLVGLDLSPLILPNLGKWQAIKVSVSMDEEGTQPGNYLDDPEDSSRVNPYHWHFDARMLSIVVGQGWRIHVTPNSRRLRFQDKAAPVLWDDIAKALRSFRLSGVVLSGIQRQVRVTSDIDVDVYNDVRAIRQSIKDEFRVPEVTIRVAGKETDTEVLVNFPARLVAANSAVSAKILFDIARSLLARDPG